MFRACPDSIKFAELTKHLALSTTIHFACSEARFEGTLAFTEDEKDLPAV
jgi:hypothetical protein